MNAGRLTRLDDATQKLSDAIGKLEQFGANSFFILPIAVTLKLAAIIAEYQRGKHPGEISNYDAVIKDADSRLIEWREDIRKSLLQREQSLTEIQTYTTPPSATSPPPPKTCPLFGIFVHARFSYLGKDYQETSGFDSCFNPDTKQSGAYKDMEQLRNGFIRDLETNRNNFEDEYLPAVYKLREAWATAGNNAMGKRAWGATRALAQNLCYVLLYLLLTLVCSIPVNQNNLAWLPKSIPTTPAAAP